MPDEHGTVRNIAWRELFPWLQLVTALRLAMRVRMLLVATLALLLTIAGWFALAKLFGGAEDTILRASLGTNGYRSSPWAETPIAPAVPPLQPAAMDGRLFAPPNVGQFGQQPFYAGWWELSAPFRQLFDHEVTFTSLAFLLLAGLWVVAVWALFGGMIARMAALQLAREENIGWKPAFEHAKSKWLSYFSAPLLPLLGILIITVPTALVGLLLRFDFGVLLAAVAWPVLMIGGLLMTIFLLGLFFGWPLMWAAVSTESSDAFDAISRAYSYVYQRPWHYLFYAAVASVLGLAGGTLVYYFASAVIYLTVWAVSWGGGPMSEVLVDPSGLSTAGQWGAALIDFWNGLVRLVAIAFAYSYFWTASTSIYLLLRYQVDGAEMDEIFVEEGPESFGLPPLGTDSAGVPVVSPEGASSPTVVPAAPPPASGHS